MQMGGDPTKKLFFFSSVYYVLWIFSHQVVNQINVYTQNVHLSLYSAPLVTEHEDDDIYF